MLGQPLQLRVRPGAGEYLSVARRNLTPALALQCTHHHSRTTAACAGVDHVI
jgi:hypothetical protein